MPGSAGARHAAERTRRGAFGGVLDRLVHLELTHFLDLPTRRSRAQTRTGAASEVMTDFQKLAAEFTHNPKPTFQRSPFGASVRNCGLFCFRGEQKASDQQATTPRSLLGIKFGLAACRSRAHENLNRPGSPVRVAWCQR